MFMEKKVCYGNLLYIQLLHCIYVLLLDIFTFYAAQYCLFSLCLTLMQFYQCNNDNRLFTSSSK